ncbi:hypothetical protein [Allomesorhizobium alhagi]|jgi:hypothetical protein|uniref:Uncharacterized protein n=1 Tax=Mesorhizobium alhagi CCNWXJ12-2 TaxID=1107882 RepID=H0HQH5_9HYPH|nr:hypothetical protein [Mesorhizobium alhagi]EHK56996.1 hypothetical protein MAXJ12_12027 [Mesorhizobium alhagi CCNWXJ12-2]
MRLLFLLIFLIGAAIGIGYPYVILNFPAQEIGTWRVYDSVGGFRPVQATLAATDAPVQVLVDVMSSSMPQGAEGAAILTITAAAGGRTVLAETLALAGATVRDDSPQTPQKIYRIDAGPIDEIEDGVHTFTLGPGDAEGLDLESVDLILLAAAGAYDQRAQPLGFSLMAIGFIGFVLAMRRGRPERNPNSQPPKPRWGRGGEPR